MLALTINSLSLVLGIYFSESARQKFKECVNAVAVVKNENV